MSFSSYSAGVVIYAAYKIGKQYFNRSRRAATAAAVEAIVVAQTQQQDGIPLDNPPVAVEAAPVGSTQLVRRADHTVCLHVDAYTPRHACTSSQAAAKMDGGMQLTLQRLERALCRVQKVRSELAYVARIAEQLQKHFGEGWWAQLPDLAAINDEFAKQVPRFQHALPETWVQCYEAVEIAAFHLRTDVSAGLVDDVRIMQTAQLLGNAALDLWHAANCCQWTSLLSINQCLRYIAATAWQTEVLQARSPEGVVVVILPFMDIIHSNSVDREAVLLALEFCEPGILLRYGLGHLKIVLPSPPPPPPAAPQDVVVDDAQWEEADLTADFSFLE